MRTYSVIIRDSFIEKAFLSFLTALDISHKAQPDSEENKTENIRIIPAEMDGSPTLLFGKWENLDVEPEKLRRDSWRRNST